ncbi:MAG: hypothetical protein V4481_02390 [Patescibacteria group bacterium]
MAFSYPRKQTVIIFIVCIVAVGATAYYVLGDKSDAISNGKIEVLTATAPEATPIISANDNWKEEFVNASALTKASVKNTPPPEEATLTGRFGSDFFIKYIGLQQSGQLSNAAIATQNYEDVVDNALAAEQPILYKLKDVHVVPDSIPNALETWKTGIVRALSLYTWTQNEGMIARDAVERQDPDVLKKITPIISGYSKIIAALKSTPAPESVSLTMVDLINAFSTLQFSAQSFKAITADPMRGMVAINSYTTGSKALMNALQDAGNALDEAGVDLQVNSLVMDVPFRY